MSSLEDVRSKHDKVVVETVLKSMESVLHLRLSSESLQLREPTQVSRPKMGFDVPELQRIRQELEPWCSHVHKPLTLELLWPTVRLDETRNAAAMQSCASNSPLTWPVFCILAG